LEDCNIFFAKIGGEKANAKVEMHLEILSRNNEIYSMRFSTLSKNGAGFSMGQSQLCAHGNKFNKNITKVGFIDIGHLNQGGYVKQLNACGGLSIDIYCSW
jgi:hypothetical protein